MVQNQSLFETKMDGSIRSKSHHGSTNNQRRSKCRDQKCNLTVNWHYFSKKVHFHCFLGEGINGWLFLFHFWIVITLCMLIWKQISLGFIKLLNDRRGSSDCQQHKCLSSSLTLYCMAVSVSLRLSICSESFLLNITNSVGTSLNMNMSDCICK